MMCDRRGAWFLWFLTAVVLAAGGARPPSAPPVAAPRDPAVAPRVEVVHVSEDPSFVGTDMDDLGFGIGYKHNEGQSVMILARRR
jgi:hypothetical protein